MKMGMRSYYENFHLVKDLFGIVRVTTISNIS